MSIMICSPVANFGDYPFARAFSCILVTKDFAHADLAHADFFRQKKCASQGQVVFVL
jgi:hypothetical protein